MAQLLNPEFKDITSVYTGEFVDMAEVDVPLEELLEVRRRLVELIHEGLTDSERSFLLLTEDELPSRTRERSKVQSTSGQAASGIDPGCFRLADCLA